MPIHDWTRVDAGVFHDFHQTWILKITDVLNRQLLPPDHYALIERYGAGFEPDVLALRTRIPGGGNGPGPDTEPTGAGVSLAEPRARVRAETDLDFYRRKQNVVAVRHVSGDELVAVVEIVSKGNKSGRKAMADFLRKGAEFLQHGIHLLILDLQPPTSRDLQGLHGLLWEEMTGDDEYQSPQDKPLTLAAYEASGGIRAFVEPVAVGDALIDMPLFLSRGRYVSVPLEATYQAAVDAVPRRWREVLEPWGPAGSD